MAEFYLGIDPGYSARDNTTGLCILCIEQGNLNWMFCNTGLSDEVRLNSLRNLIADNNLINGIGIDGPLAHGLQRIASYRTADAMLSRGLFRTRCKPYQTNSRDGQRLHMEAIRLAELVLRLQQENFLNILEADHLLNIHEKRIVEAFPTAFLRILLEEDIPPVDGERRARTDIYWELTIEGQQLHNLIEHLVPQVVVPEDPAGIDDHENRAALDLRSLRPMCSQQSIRVTW